MKERGIRVDSDRSIVLTGFMGVGKSAVGRVLAERLGRPFVDMDTEIERRAGKTIPEIFAEDGESTFRELERELCLELASSEGLVIATGGGSLLEPDCRSVMTRSALAICLTCEFEELARRLQSNETRPLLCGKDLGAAERLLAARREAYLALPWHVDTTGRGVEEVVESVARLFEAQRISVGHPAGSYDILLGRGALAHLGDAVRQAGIATESRIVIVTNPVVEALYAEAAESSLARAGFRVGRCLVPDGEQHKTLETARTVYDRLLGLGIDRSGVIVGLGGGVTGDIAGFVAATYMRGIRFIQVPTTLLAMVDASVGGKTGVDLPEGKNLVGAFKQPELVLIDPRVLGTLSEEEVRSGNAELIKHGVLGDPDLFARLKDEPADRDTLSGSAGVDRIARALAVKIAVVEADPLEGGRRMHLNLGHTIGHALELLSGYSLRHGEAVSIGMVVAARLAVRLDEAAAATAEAIERVLANAGLPTDCPSHLASEILDALGHDKKRRNGRLRWILPRSIGDVTVNEAVSLGLVRDVLIEMGARSS